MSHSDRQKRWQGQNTLYEQLCSDLNQENKLEELRALAIELEIPYSGKKKAELCQAIAHELQTLYGLLVYSTEEFYGDE